MCLSGVHKLTLALRLDCVPPGTLVGYGSNRRTCSVPRHRFGDRVAASIELILNASAFFMRIQVTCSCSGKPWPISTRIDMRCSS